MANFFNSRTNFAVKNYSYYAPSDSKLHDIGLASYTRNSIENFGKIRSGATAGIDPDISEYFSNQFDIARTTLLGDSATLRMQRFDKDGKRYIETTSTGQGENHIFWTPSGTNRSEGGGVAFTTLKTFQEKFDLYQKGFIKLDSAKDEDKLFAYNVKYIWSKIVNSFEGCLSFNAQYSILNSQASGDIKIFFQSKSDGSDRSVAFQPPIIAGIGRTPTGKEHAFGISETLPAGSFSAPDIGGINNPKNTVAGPLKLNFNRGTGEWESGTTQVYCRLLDDIPGVVIEDLPENPDNSNNESLKLPFASGYGLFFNSEKGNPHLVVPVSFGCEVSPKEKILLINRSVRAFTKGEVVLASQINGDWVPIPLSNGVSVAKRLVVDWSHIQRYIVNAKSFFRDAQDTRFIEPKDYVNAVRAKFYNSLPSATSKLMTDNLMADHNDVNRLRAWNLVTRIASEYSLNPNGTVVDPTASEIDDAVSFAGRQQNLQPNLAGYFQFFDADFLPVDIGGNNSTSTKLRNTVIKRTARFSESMGPAASEVPVSWGLYFPDGYSSLGVRKTKATRQTIPVTPPRGGIVYNGGTLNFANYVSSIFEGLNLTFNLRDQYFYHLPAQFAMNSSGNPSIEANLMSAAYNGPGAASDNYAAYMNIPLKGHYLANTSYKPVYGLTPINSTFVQFTPLSLELALSTTKISDFGAGSQPWFNGGYKDLKRALQTAGTYNGNYFGRAWERIGMNDVTLEPDGSVQGKLTFGTKLINWALPRNDAIGGIGLPRRGDRPDGGPEIFPKEGITESSNVVGIIAAKATLSMARGGIIELKTDNNIGMLAYKRATLSQTNISVSTLFIFVQDLSGRSVTLEYVQWGGSLGPEQVKELGTTALWCAIYDHTPNIIYDGRFFAPLQFNPSGASVDFEEVFLQPGTILGSGSTTPKTITNKVRRNMLLSEGGFAYSKKYIGLDITSMNIKKAGSGYTDLDKVRVNIGGIQPAKLVVTGLTGNGGIASLGIDESELNENGPSYIYGETAGGGTVNPFKFGPTSNASIESVSGAGAEIVFTRGKVYERLMVDNLGFYGYKKLTPEDNQGQGNDRGFVTGTHTTTFAVDQNSTGKYDIFLFFVSDIANYPEGGVIFEGTEAPSARYVTLEITTT